MLITHPCLNLSCDLAAWISSYIPLKTIEINYLPHVKMRVIIGLFVDIL